MLNILWKQIFFYRLVSQNDNFSIKNLKYYGKIFFFFVLDYTNSFIKIFRPKHKWNKTGLNEIS